MAIENEQEVVEYLKKEENKGFLEKNGFSTFKEIEKVVEKPLTAEVVKGFIEGNQEFKKSFLDEGIKTYIKEKTGAEIDENILKEGIFLKKDIDSIKKVTVGKLLENVKYGDLLMSKIDFDKIEFKEGKLNGLDEQINLLKTAYKDLFGGLGTKDTPPPAPNPEPKTELEKIEQEIEELSKKPSMANRLKIMTLNSKKNNLLKK